jgi:hypothetical protein
MLHALYIIAFAVLSVIAISNLIRNLISLGSDARRGPRDLAAGRNATTGSSHSVPHPEMLDDAGRVVDEPLLVMKSISLEDAREQLDALYDSSASGDRASDEES